MKLFHKVAMELNWKLFVKYKALHQFKALTLLFFLISNEDFALGPLQHFLRCTVQC